MSGKIYSQTIASRLSDLIVDRIMVLRSGRKSKLEEYLGSWIANINPEFSKDVELRWQIKTLKKVKPIMEKLYESYNSNSVYTGQFVVEQLNIYQCLLDEYKSSVLWHSDDL